MATEVQPESPAATPRVAFTPNDVARIVAAVPTVPARIRPDVRTTEARCYVGRQLFGNPLYTQHVAERLLNLGLVVTRQWKPGIAYAPKRRQGEADCGHDALLKAALNDPDFDKGVALRGAVVAVTKPWLNPLNNTVKSRSGEDMTTVQLGFVVEDAALHAEQSHFPRHGSAAELAVRMWLVSGADLSAENGYGGAEEVLNSVMPETLELAKLDHVQVRPEHRR